MRAVVRKSSVSEIEGNSGFAALADEYAAEAAIKGLPSPLKTLDLYRGLEKSNSFEAYGAFVDDAIIGLIATLTPVLPHYGVAVTVAESFFVRKDHRPTGAGTKLLHVAEQHARDILSPGILVSAPIGSKLAEVLSRHKSYHETNRVFFRNLADA